MLLAGEFERNLADPFLPVFRLIMMSVRQKRTHNVSFCECNHLIVRGVSQTKLFPHFFQCNCITQPQDGNPLPFGN